MFNAFKISINRTFKEWMDAFNSLADKLDELPLPVAFGTNSKMKYLKLANGTIFMWGRVDYGKNFPCTVQWEGNGGGGWASAEFTLDFPIALVSNSPVVIPHVFNTMRAETFCLETGVSYSAFKGRFWSAAEDNGGASTLNIVVIGDWK